MEEFDPNIKEQLQGEIDLACEIWKDSLTKHLKVKYAYTKGSAIKPWDSIIDYVPGLSDLDIHFTVEKVDEHALDSIDLSLSISKFYDEQFKLRANKPIHMPRIQAMLMNKYVKDDEFISSSISSMKFLIGDIGLMKLNHPSADVIQKLDCERLEEDYNYIQTVPYSLFDRNGLDFWQLLRRLTWRVAPTVPRLLSQFVTDPLELWSKNRTYYYNHLISLDYNSLAEHYSEFYKTGWDLFHTGFRDGDLFRKIIKLAYEIINSAYIIMKSVK